MAGRPLASAAGFPPLLFSGGRDGGGEIDGSSEEGVGGAAFGAPGGGDWLALGGAAGLDVGAVSLVHGGVRLDEVAGSDGLGQQGGSSSRGGSEKKGEVPWSALFSSSSSSLLGDGLKLSFVEPEEIEGVRVATCPESIIKEGLEKWRNTLMGHFIGGRPSFTFALDLLLKQWKISGHVDANLLDSGFFIFRFNLEEDKIKVLEGVPWYVQRMPMILRPWSPNACLERVDLCSVPIWISLPNLPFHFWSSQALSSIGSVIGQPIVTDKMTRAMERLSYARLCVEVSADKDLPLSVPVYGDEGNVQSQKSSRSRKEWHVKGAAGNDDGVLAGGDDGLPEVQAGIVAGQPSVQVGESDEVSNVDSVISDVKKGSGDCLPMGKGPSFGKRIFKNPVTSLGEHSKAKGLAHSNAFALLEDLTEEVHYDPAEMMLDSDSCAILLGNDLFEEAGLEEEDCSPIPLAILPNLEKKDHGEYPTSKDSESNLNKDSISDLVEKIPSALPMEVQALKDKGEVDSRSSLEMADPNPRVDAVVVPAKPLANFERLKKQAEEVRAIQGQFGKDWKYLHNGEADAPIRIWLGWDSNVFKVEEIQKTLQFIHVRVSILGTSITFLCTTVYAVNAIEGRKDLWRDVGAFASSILDPWAVLGDFNVVRNQNEKFGGDPIRQEAVDDFNSFVDDTGLVDLNWKGEIFTWNNRQSGDTRICCKLDRVLVNLGWMDVLRSSEATVLPPSLSDHSPVVVAILDATNFGPKPFRFFEAWIGRDGFDETVVKGWEQPAARTELTQIQSNLGPNPSDPNLVSLETQAKRKLWEALAIEEKFLKEKSRVKHIQLGDGNNSFFHKSMEDLIGPVANKEILEVVFAMKSSKASGPDGFGAAFFKHCWDVVGEDLTLA
ncbi:uncharacterized protein LOC122648415, partial [Telopea speciosissima]|uniref:uncharacterized protein LOC122648415 n=1 Tax=Telopea speciosissima TaxID=54955 RepID=UPI001CC79D48